MERPRFLSSYLLQIGELDEERVHRLAGEFAAVAGVADVVLVPEDGMAYLKVDRKKLDEDALVRLAGKPLQGS